MILKRCSFCENDLPVEQFSKHSASKDGMHSYCKSCQKIYRTHHYAQNRDVEIQNRKKWRNACEGNKELDRKAKQRWKKKNPLTYEQSWRSYNHKFRHKVLSKVAGAGELICVRCGCDKFEVLEINHINGGGLKETKRQNQKFYTKIVKGERNTDDLEILCKVCNAWHCLELKHGQLPFKVIWEAN